MFAFPRLGHRPLDRRRFLALGALIAAALAGSACGSESDSRVLAHPDLLDVLGPDVVRSLGRHYRESVPREREATQLEAAIRASRPLAARLGVRHLAMGEQVRDDFDSGRTIIIDGWLLSLTEARQCALYELGS